MRDFIGGGGPGDGGGGTGDGVESNQTFPIKRIWVSMNRYARLILSKRIWIIMKRYARLHWRRGSGGRMHSYTFYLIAGGGPGDGLQSNQTFDETQKTAIDFAIIHVCVFCVDMGID